jgi:hypothetical protein
VKDTAGLDDLVYRQKGVTCYGKAAKVWRTIQLAWTIRLGERTPSTDGNDGDTTSRLYDIGALRAFVHSIIQHRFRGGSRIQICI